MSTKDKSERTVAVYFDTVEQKKKFERQASRYGVSMSKLVKLALEVGKPIVLRSLRKMKRENVETVEAITEKTKVK
jgi:hypothetical protein